MIITKTCAGINMFYHIPTINTSAQTSYTTTYHQNQSKNWISEVDVLEYDFCCDRNDVAFNRIQNHENE